MVLGGACGPEAIDACSYGDAGAEDDRDAADDGLPGELFVEDECGPEDAEDRLGELHLADLGHGPDGESAIPGEESQEHAHDSEVGKRGPLGERAGRWLVDGSNCRQGGHEGRGQNEGPRYGLPGSDLAREQASLGVADGGGRDGTE